MGDWPASHRSERSGIWIGRLHFTSVAKHPLADDGKEGHTGCPRLKAVRLGRWMIRGFQGEKSFVWKNSERHSLTPVLFSFGGVPTGNDRRQRSESKGCGIVHDWKRADKMGAWRVDLSQGLCRLSQSRVRISQARRQSQGRLARANPQSLRSPVLKLAAGYR